jgi:hypothetical protein
MTNNETKELEVIIILIKKLQAEDFTGNVQINFKLGGVSHINKLESFRISEKSLV